MDELIENPDNIIKYWKSSSEQNYVTMCNLCSSKDYNWALFIGHLVLEKILKAIYVKQYSKHPLFTHDLLRLAKKSNLEISENHEEWLDEISTFNLNARYDNYKQDFQKRCTSEYTQIWIKRIEELRLWLINQL
ncbi:MAG: HEPN domain-containing protein [Paludibacter sp.]|nr:HEPN domain-containing protein [Paludibacter sp.]